MNETNKKRRASILKKRLSNEDDQTETTINKFPKKNQIQFSQKKQVKEFMPCEENVTIWGNTYETSVTKSEGSSDGSSTSRKISVDFTQSTINATTHEVQSIMESEKENVIASSVCNSSNSSVTNSIELTLNMDANERKRVKHYGTDNLNITNMPLDSSINNSKLQSIDYKLPQMVMSPRKMIFINKQTNMSVVIKDKVFMNPSERAENVSITLEDDEITNFVKKVIPQRKTITQPVDMNMSIENNPAMVPPKKYNLRNSISKTSPNVTSTVAPESTPTVASKSTSTVAPTIFKLPDMPKTFKFNPASYESPPIKPVIPENQKQEIEELFEMMVSDTPSKNLCCLGKTHTPSRSEQKVLYSAARPTSLRKSTDIFKEMGLLDDEDEVGTNKPHPVRRTIFHDNSMKLDDHNAEKESRKTTFDKLKMDETIELKCNKNKDESNLDISIEHQKVPISEASIKVVNVENTKMDETCVQRNNKIVTDKSATQSQHKAMFDLDEGEELSKSVTKNIPLMKLRSENYEFEDKSNMSNLNKRSTLSNDTYNATNFIMELTNIDDIGDSLETTAQLQRHAAKLLKNPHATLGSSSTINSPFPDDISDFVPRDALRVQKSFVLEPSLPANDSNKNATMNRLSVFKQNNMDISGVEPTDEFPKVNIREYSMQNVSKMQNESTKTRQTIYNSNAMDVTKSRISSFPMHLDENNQEHQTDSAKNRQTMCNINAMDITRAGTPTIPIFEDENTKECHKKRDITYDRDHMDIEKNRKTVFDAQNMNVSQKIPNNPQPLKNENSKEHKRMTTYNADQMDVSVDEEAIESQSENKTALPSTSKSFSVQNVSKMQNESTRMRQTIFDADAMEITRAGTPKFSIFEDENHQEYSAQNVPKMQANPVKSRQTVYNTDGMDITRAETLSFRIDLDEGNNEHSAQTDSVNNRQTMYNLNAMDLTRVETSSFPIFKDKNTKECHKKRDTTYDRDHMDVEKNRKSVFHAQNMDVSQKMLNDEHLEPLNNENFKSHKRATTYNTDHMDVSVDEEAIESQSENKATLPSTSKDYSAQSVSKMQNELTKTRNTIYNANAMDITRAETPTFPNYEDEKRQEYSAQNISKIQTIPVKSRQTVYDANVMDITRVETPSFPIYSDENRQEYYAQNEPAKTRQTIYNANAIDVTKTRISTFPIHLVEVNKEQFAQTDSAKSRQTIYNTNVMDITRAGTPSFPIYSDENRQEYYVQNESTKTRQTIYNTNAMDITRAGTPSLPIYSDENRQEYYVQNESTKTRQTIYNTNAMEITRAGTPSFPICSDENRQEYYVQNESTKTRQTIFNANAMDTTRAGTPSIPVFDDKNTKECHKKRDTTYDRNHMEVEKNRNTVFHAQNMDVSQKELNEENFEEHKRTTTYNKNQMDVSVDEEANLRVNRTQLRSISPSIFLDSPVPIHVDDNLKESPQYKKRATTFIKNNMEMSYTISEKNRKTTYDANNMELSLTEKVRDENNDAIKTFTLTSKKRESLKWHNVTDQDMMHMLHDESNPCINDLSGSNQISDEVNNVSKYEEAMEDFMNLTVKASPLNQSIALDVEIKARRQSRIPSPLRNYNNMLEDLVNDLLKKSQPRPRLEMDEYLDKMKIEPVKIPRYVQNEPDYLLDKIIELRMASKARKEERQMLRKEQAATQFPQIPSKKFLIKNLIDCMEEEIMRIIDENPINVPPVFPTNMSFDRLLANKFRNDENLSKYWYFDSTFWYKGVFKLIHRKMEMFTLNVKCQQYLSEADDSTIPIIFKDIILYQSPEYRKKCSITRMISLLKCEFHRAINGVDNFTSICGMSTQLFEFLDYYHSCVMKAVEVVNNFFNILNKYKAICKVNSQNSCLAVFKRIFMPNDIVDITISIEGYLEDTKVENLSIKGRCFEYTLQQHENITDLRGLMLIELILFDTEKFLQTHTGKKEAEIIEI